MLVVGCTITSVPTLHVFVPHAVVMYTVHCLMTINVSFLSAIKSRTICAPIEREGLPNPGYGWSDTTELQPMGWVDVWPDQT
jgi:hypothetical protein